MADALQTRFVPLLTIMASCLLGVQSTPQSPTVHSTSRGPPPPLPQYYVTSSQRPPSGPPPSTSSSLAPTSPVYTAQRIRPSSSYNSAEYDDPYPASALLGTARTTSGVALEDADAADNSGFVQPIDFSSLLKDIGSSPKGVGLDIGASSSNPLFASESKDTFQGFFGSTKNPFEELSRLNTASSDQRPRSSTDEDNVGFVDPNVQFRSLFDSAGTSAGFKPEDFLGSKSENIGSDPSKGSQTRAYPSFTYSGRLDAEREDLDRDYNGRGDGPNRYRSSYRQVGSGSNGHGGSRDYYPESNNLPDYYDSSRGSRGQYDDYDGISNSPQTDSYDDDDGGHYAGSSGRGRGTARGPAPSYERATPRYSQAAQETSNSPQSKPRATESKNPRCKKVEKQVDYNDDHASFTEPDEDYDPSTYQGRYKRQARQRSRGNSNRRPMTCYVCQDEHGRYAEKCSYDSKGSPSDGAYFHSESSSYSDNGRRPNNGNGGGSSKERSRRSGNRQRSSGELSSAESTTKAVRIEPEVGESEGKNIDKRQAGQYRNYGGNDDYGSNPNKDRDVYPDPYDASSGSYRHPTGYEGPPLSGDRRPSYHGGSSSSGERGRGYTGERGNDGFDSDFDYGPPADYEREAAAASKDFDFSIPRDFDPDVQLRPNNNNQGNNYRRGGSGNGEGRGPPRESNSFQPEYFHNSNRRQGPETSASNRRDNLDDFDIGYSDYMKKNFPEAFNSPGFSTPSYSSSDYEFKPNYYHRPRGREENRDDRQSPEISSSPGGHRGYSPGLYGGRGSFVPDKQHTQPRHNFAPPPGFFSEDSPTENVDNLGNIMKEFSSKSRDGCRRVHKGDMTCFVCKDARGANKEECMYASDDPKNKAMAYHEVTEYSSPTASVLPAPLHATLLGQKESTVGVDGDVSSDSGTLVVAASSLSFNKTPDATEEIKEGLASDTDSVKVLVASKPLLAKKITTTPSSKSKNKDGDKDKSVRSVKSTRVAHSSTFIIHERSKRSPKQDEYDFDY